MSGRSTEVRRLFVAVDPPAQAKAHLGAVVDRLEVSLADAPGRSTRLAPRDRWHVTLAFLGDVPVRRIGKAVAALDAAVRSTPGVAVGPVRVRFAGGGTFGRGRSAILWAGVGGDVAALRRLAGAVRTQVRRAHLPMDRREFRPHLTISRPGAHVEPALVAADVAALLSYAGPEWTVDAVHLYASDIVTTPTGPQPNYTRLASVPLP